MAKYKPSNENQMVMLPISVQDQLVSGTLEHTINELVENHLDLSVFEGRYQNDETGATAINPKVLLKVILFAYSRGMISSRQIERACGENILFMALSCGYRPDQDKLQQVLAEHIRADALERPESERRQKQVQRLQHQVERLSEFLQEQKPKVGKGRQEIQSNVTDNQSGRCPACTG